MDMTPSIRGGDKVRQVSVYKTSDGRFFDFGEDAKAHERYLELVDKVRRGLSVLPEYARDAGGYAPNERGYCGGGDVEDASRVPKEDAEKLLLSLITSKAVSLKEDTKQKEEE